MPITYFMTSPRDSRHVCDAVDFHAQPGLRQRCGLNRRPRRTMIAEHPRVDAIHTSELAHVDQEYATAQHVLQTGSRRLENRFDVAQALLGLRFDIVWHRARHWI